MLRIGQTMSNIQLQTTSGDFSIHDYFEGSWGVLFCYVADFSAVCTDELSRLVNEYHEFRTRGIKILAISCDSIDSHIKWIEDIKKMSEMECDEKFPFPIVSDRNRVFSLYLNVLDAKCIDDEGIPLPCRATFVLTPDMTIQIMQFYPQTTGRNVDEILRSIDAVQLSFEYDNDIFTSCGWKANAECFVSPKVSKKDIEHKFPSSTVINLPSGKDYMRIVSRTMIKGLTMERFFYIY